MAKHRLTMETESTQVRFPWRATIRTVLVAALAILPLLPEIAKSADIHTVPAVVSVLTVAAAIQRIITTPVVDHWLNRILLGSSPKEETRGKRHSDENVTVLSTY